MKYIALRGVIVAVVGGVIVSSLYLSTANTVQAQDGGHMAHHAVLQVDIDRVYAPFGQPGFFKLLADFTDMQVMHGHVAISNVNCDTNGKSPFVAVIANANVGAGNTQLHIIPLDSSNLVNDVSFPGKYCTYHVDIHAGMDGIEFPITDIALANSSNSAQRPHSTASATIHAEIVKMMD